jgi:hypothetical protein
MNPRIPMRNRTSDRVMIVIYILPYGIGVSE